MEYSQVTIISIALGLAGCIISYLSYALKKAKKATSEAKEITAISTTLDIWAVVVKDIKADMKLSKIDHSGLAERVARAEEKLNSAHKRIDNLEKKGDK